MSRTITRDRSPAHRRGLTLIEVVAALALLGTLLGAIVLARARYAHQWSAAERRLEAAAALDELLETWSAQPAAIPSDDSGELTERLRWSTRSRDDDALAYLSVRIVRVEVFEPRNQGAEALLAHAELFVPTPTPTPDAPEADHAEGEQR